MPKCDFNKVTRQLYCNCFSARVYSYTPINLLHIFRTPFLKTTSRRQILCISDDFLRFTFLLVSMSYLQAYSFGFICSFWHQPFFYVALSPLSLSTICLAQRFISPEIGGCSASSFNFLILYTDWMVFVIINFP